MPYIIYNRSEKSLRLIYCRNMEETNNENDDRDPNNKTDRPPHIHTSMNQKSLLDNNNPLICH